MRWGHNLDRKFQFKKPGIGIPKVTDNWNMCYYGQKKKKKLWVFQIWQESRRDNMEEPKNDPKYKEGSRKVGRWVIIEEDGWDQSMLENLIMCSVLNGTSSLIHTPSPTTMGRSISRRGLLDLTWLLKPWPHSSWGYLYKIKPVRRST